MLRKGVEVLVSTIPACKYLVLVSKFKKWYRPALLIGKRVLYIYTRSRGVLFSPWGNEEAISKNQFAQHNPATFLDWSSLPN